MDSGPCSCAIELQSFRDQVQCLIPADGLEGFSLAAVGAFSLSVLRAGGAWGRAAAKENRPGPDICDLGAEKTTRDRMRRVTLHPGRFTRLIDGHENSARVRAVV